MLAPIESIEALPTALPVFPLPGLLLLPRCQLPLHIFEPRYRAMLGDVLNSHGMIGMIQPLESVESEHPVLFKTGTVGRVISHKEMVDGRYYVILEGVCRFDIAREFSLAVGGYREVLPSYDNYAADLVEEIVEIPERGQLMDRLARYSRVKQMTLAHASLDELPDGELLMVFCTGLPFSPEDKQALLEAPNSSQRVKLILTLLELESHEEPSGSGLPQ